MSKPVPLPAPWVRTARGNPCPVCHCHAGCLLSGPTDPAAVICRRVPSDMPWAPAVATRDTARADVGKLGPGPDTDRQGEDTGHA